MTTQNADRTPSVPTSLEDIVPLALLEPVLRRPIPFVAAAFGAGLLTGIVLRARGDLVADESLPGMFSGRQRPDGRPRSLGAFAGGEPPFDASLSREVGERLRSTLVEAAASYLDRAVDRMADATQRAVRP